MSSAGTILVVEDDTAVLGLVLHMLAGENFTVLSASTAYEALNLLRQRSIDLLFTDIIMPGMDGVDLAREARLMQPGLKVMFATGYSHVAAARGAIRQGRILYKPLRESEVMQAVEQLLSS